MDRTKARDLERRAHALQASMEVHRLGDEHLLPIAKAYECAAHAWAQAGSLARAGVLYELARAFARIMGEDDSILSANVKECKRGQTLAELDRARASVAKERLQAKKRALGYVDALGR